MFCFLIIDCLYMGCPVMGIDINDQKSNLLNFY